ncbi:MAG: flagellar protein FlaG [Deltaproteobacteria bacterium]|nr:flagellar protein FlaG [Deltaproteobacteria bacterium]
MSMEFAIKDISRAATERPGEASGKTAAAKKAEVRSGVITDAAEAKKDLPPKEVEEIASDVQIHLKRLNTELRFEVDNESDEMIIKIIDPETKQVIRQIPSEELLAIRERMKDLIGVLYNARS